MSTNSLARTEPKETRLSDAVTRRGITEAQWITLTNSLYPGAAPASVAMVWDYCQARGLDPLKKPCHIVPIEVKQKDGTYVWRDVVMPGIYEYRTTAHRTGLYLGHSKPEYGADVEIAGVKAPEWCEMVIYRHVPGSARAEFPVRVLFAEVVATTKGGKANSRWSRAPVQMLTKCCEAAGLREAFPEQLGGEQTFEEMDGQRHIERAGVIDVDPESVKVAPDGFDDWLDNLRAVADEGEAKFSAMWAESREDYRAYLTETDPTQFDTLKAKALSVLG